MPSDSIDVQHVLFLRAGSLLCALPLNCVEETMRPMTCDPVPGMPSFLRGMAVIRGKPIPVVDLGCILKGTPSHSSRRLVLLRLDRRQIAMEVDEVLALCEVDGSVLQGLPPLLDQADSALVTDIGMRDERLLFVLEAARLVPAELWKELDIPVTVP